MKVRRALCLLLALLLTLQAVPAQAAQIVQEQQVQQLRPRVIPYAHERCEDDIPSRESDNNHTPALADPIGDEYVYHGRLRPKDVDYYTFTLPQASTVGFGLYVATRCASVQFVSSAGAPLTQPASAAYDSGDYYYSQIAHLPAGTHYLRIAHNGADGIDAEYLLSFVIEPGTCAHSYSTKAVAPTCTAQGYTLKTCVYCGDSSKSHYTSALGHSGVPVVQVSGGCGTVNQQCSRCGISLGTSVARGWKFYNGKYHYFSDSGKLQTGWVLVGGKWYYLDGAGEMLTGWVRDKGIWYYLDRSGAMRTGWEKVGGIWYYFDASGAMQIGWEKVGGIWYYFSSSGAMLTGWRHIGSHWYYFAPSGAMQTGWVQLGGVWYYLFPDGHMATGAVTISGQRHVFSPNGTWLR